MAGALNLDKLGIFTIGDLVQRGTGNPYSGEIDAPEGILIKIYRQKASDSFTFTVDWQDGQQPETLHRTQLSRTQYAAYPEFNDLIALNQVWVEGDPHYWVRVEGAYRSEAYCIFCEQKRTHKPNANASLCQGPR